MHAPKRLSLPKTLMVLLVILSSLTASSWAAEAYARVTFVTGKALVKLAGAAQEIPVKRGDSYPAGTVIKTGKSCFVGISFNSGGGLSIAPSSLMRIEELQIEKRQQVITERKTILKIDSGNVTAFLDKTDVPTDFKIIAPTGIAAARGTIWNVNVENGSFSIVDGIVQFDHASGRSLSLGALQGAIANDDGTITQVDLTDDQVQSILRFLRRVGFTVVVNEFENSFTVTPESVDLDTSTGNTDSVTPTTP